MGYFPHTLEGACCPVCVICFLSCFSLELQLRQRRWQMDPAVTLMDSAVTSKKSNLCLELVAPGIWFARTSIIFYFKFLIYLADPDKPGAARQTSLLLSN